MKNKNKPAGSKLTVFTQICQLIPGHLVSKLAREHGVEEQARTFSPWSHVVAMIYAQSSHALSLNDVCDGLSVHENILPEIRGAKLPSRNGLSHSNRNRDAGMAQALYWSVLEHLTQSHAGFDRQHGGKNFAYKFKRRIHLADATTIQLVANCMSWAKHRQRKAAAKCHLRLDLQTFLPSFVIIDTGHEHEATRARELCADLASGEIVVFDKGYTDLEHFANLNRRGVFWVTRAKDSLAYEVEQERETHSENILWDSHIRLKYYNSKKAYAETFRLVRAKVMVDGKEEVMEFITNNLDWSASSVADLYRCRWQIEIFFKSLKQNLQIGSFLGYSANAVRWQIWIGLLVHLLMRFLQWKSQWTSHFGRLFTLLRCTLWYRWEVKSVLTFYGTAGPHRRMRSNAQQAFLPGFC
jgi:hypothetical protein